MMLMSKHLVGLASCDKVDDIVLAEILLNGKDGLESHYKLFFGSYLLLGMEAVVAVAAIVLVVTLTEIMKQHLSSAHRRLGVCSGLL